MAGPLREVPLEGGIANRGLVIRVGNTVRRPPRSTSAATHALLRYLADVGFDGAPRILGVDDQGREVLTYIEGEAVTEPYPAWALTDAALTSVAHLMKRYHDAVSGFDAGQHVWPKSPPAPYAAELVSHNDPNLDNIVFRDGSAVAFIDFDLASPGSRLWDLAAASRFWAPLRDDAYIADSRRGRSLQRFRAIVDAYGLGQSDRGRLVDAVALNHDWLYTIVRSGAQQGNPGFSDYWARAADRVQHTREWYNNNHRVLAETLTMPLDEFNTSATRRD
jgi:hypothetical protein